MSKEKEDFDLSEILSPKPNDSSRQIYLRGLINKSIGDVKQAIASVRSGDKPEEHLEITLIRTYRQIFELRECPPVPTVGMTEEDVFLDE